MKRLSVIALALAVCCLTSWTAWAGPEGGKSKRNSKAWQKKVAAYRARVADEKAKRKAARDKRARRKGRSKRSVKNKAKSDAKKAKEVNAEATPNMADMDAEVPPPPAKSQKTAETAKNDAAKTPLTLRPTGKPASLKEKPEESNWWYKGIFLFIAVAGGGLILHKRGGRFKLPTPKTPQLKVVARTSLGVRSELVVAEVDGMRILLGVTPNGISRIEKLGAAAVSEPMDLAESMEEMDEDEMPLPTRSSRRASEKRAAERRLSLFEEDDAPAAPADFQNALEDMQRRLEKHESRREGRSEKRDSHRAPARQRRRAAGGSRAVRGGGQARSLLRAVQNNN